MSFAIFLFPKLWSQESLRYILQHSFQILENKVKHEYLRSRAYICLSLSSSSGDISIKSWAIEILVLTSWIPASKNFFLQSYRPLTFTKTGGWRSLFQKGTKVNKESFLELKFVRPKKNNFLCLLTQVYKGLYLFKKDSQPKSNKQTKKWKALSLFHQQSITRIGMCNKGKLPKNLKNMFLIDNHFHLVTINWKR